MNERKDIYLFMETRELTEKWGLWRLIYQFSQGKEEEKNISGKNKLF